MNSIQACCRLRLAFSILVCLFVIPPASLVNAQEAPANYRELDRWRGSSLGIRIDRQEEKVFVKEVRDHVKKFCPLKVGDQLISIGSLTINPESLGRLGEMMSSLDPDSVVKCVVERDGKRQSVSYRTYRRQLVDIAAIVQQLEKSQVIKDYLKETGRDDFMETVEQRMVDAVRKSESPRQAAEAMNQIIDEIDISHTAIMPRQSMDQLQGQAAGDTGLTLQRHSIDGKSGYFVIDRMPGSIGYESELQLGDRIEEINGVPIEDSRRLILSGQEYRRQVFFLAVAIGDELEVQYRRRQNAKRKSCTLVARASVPAEDVIELSAKILESNGNKYGYLRFWNLMSMRTTALYASVVEEQFENCDVLVLDLRGRGGLIPVVISLDLAIKRSKVPVVAITDDLTRSAKEMLSLLIKKHPHVTVIGQTTAGAVTGATMTQLPSGMGLMFPVVSSDTLKQFTGDVILERVGVDPDIKVDFQIPFCGGNDRLLEAAIETADQLVKEMDSIIAR